MIQFLYSCFNSFGVFYSGYLIFLTVASFSRFKGRLIPYFFSILYLVPFISYLFIQRFATISSIGFYSSCSMTLDNSCFMILDNSSRQDSLPKANQQEINYKDQLVLFYQHGLVLFYNKNDSQLPSFLSPKDLHPYLLREIPYL